MIIINNTIITEELLNEHFICDLPRCKGDCCVSGDAGAPLEDEEVGMIEDNLEVIKAYMSTEGIAVIENEGLLDYDESGRLVTPLINGRECAFTGFHENGVSFCAIEKAWLAGESHFRKPVSCHLYPVRLEEKNGFIHLHYHQWSICVPAKRKGLRAGVPLYKFLKEALIRKFGNDWYTQLEREAQRRPKK